MDSTARKLLKRRDHLELDKWKISREVEAIDIALKAAGIKPDLDYNDINEELYTEYHPFAEMTLADACKKIVRDNGGTWLSKAQIEYLVTRGGYKFSAKDSKNSVNVTLQRLAAEGSIEAERTRGSRGNRYRYTQGGSQRVRN